MTDFSARAPPEILTLIFKTLYLSSLAIFDPAPVDGGRVFELCSPVSGVCRYWRDVALAAPFLWKYLPQIRIYDDYDNPTPRKARSPYLEPLKELIARSGSPTLHPSFHCTATGIDGPRMSSVAAYLVGRCSEWGSLSLSGVVDCIPLFFFDIGGDIPLLESLRLEFLDSDSEEPLDGNDISFFSEAPMLRSVHVLGTTDWELDLDTRSLVYLRDDVGGILHSIIPKYDFPQLTTLEVRNTGGFDFEELDPEDLPLDLPALRKLVFEADETSGSDHGFLLFPEVPSLEELSITATDGDTITDIINMRIRSDDSLPLKSLRILKHSFEYSAEGELSELLDLLPDLEVLEVAYPQYADLNDLANILVPELKKCAFTFYGDNFDDMNEGLVELISARCEPTSDEFNESVVPLELSIYADLGSFGREKHTSPGFSNSQFPYLGIQPTRAEPWYGDRAVPRSAFTEAEATIRAMLSDIETPLGIGTFNYKHTLELVERVEKSYKSKDLVNFLETNINICLISTAWFFKSHHADDRNNVHGRISRLLQKVKRDLMKTLDKFHWIWETSCDQVWIRYIRDNDELRSDPDKFANAVLGLTDDLWILEDMAEV